MSLIAAICGAFAAVIGTTWSITHSRGTRTAQALERASQVSTQLVYSATAQPTVLIRNDGTTPITNVWGRVPGDLTNAHHYSMIPPRGHAAMTVSPDGKGPNWYISYVGCGGPASSTEPLCDIWFVDSSGQAWHRHGTKPPHRVAASGPKAELVKRRRLIAR